MMKDLTTKAIAILLILLVMAGLVINTRIISKEKDRLASNNEALQENLHVKEIQIKTKDSTYNVLAVETKRLVLEKKELKEYYESEVLQKLDNLNIKLKHTTNISSTATVTDHQIFTTVKDSIVNDTVHVYPIHYTDAPWLEFNGLVFSDNFKGSIKITDSLFTVVHWNRQKKLIGIPFGKKVYKQSVYSSNPYTNITHNLYIEPKKAAKK